MNPFLARRPLNWREWLEGLYASAGPNSNHAASILEMLSQLEQIAVSYESIFGALEQAGDKDVEKEGFNVVERVKEIASEYLKIRALLVEAEVCPPDTDASLAHILRMFLPVE